MMRLSEAMRMADGNDGPVWSRTRKRRASAGPLIGLAVTLLALIGALTAGLSIKERSVEAAGARMDGWISTGWASARRLVGKAPEAADTAATKAGQAAEKTGDALEAGADAARDELKK